MNFECYNVDLNVVKRQPKILHDKDTYIQLNEDTHVYSLHQPAIEVSSNDNLKLITSEPFMSVTTAVNKFIVGEFVPPHRDSENDAFIDLGNWRSSALLGTLCHAIIEQYFRWMQKRNILSLDFKRDTDPTASQYFQYLTRFSIYALAEKFLPKNFLEKVASSIYDEMSARYPINQLSLSDAKKLMSATFLNGLVEQRLRMNLMSFDSFLNEPSRWEYMKPNWIIIQPEYLIYANAIKLAGSIDLVVWTNKAKREIGIIDWKTNKAQNLNPRKYHCQLHMYAHVIEKFYSSNLKVTHMIIVHLSLIHI